MIPLDKTELSRREFLRAGVQCLGCCATASALLSIAGCGGEEAATAPGAAPASSANVQIVQPTEKPQGTFTLAGVATTPAGKALVFQTPAKQAIFVFQANGKWQALSAKCTHAGCAVEWQAASAKDRFVCPCHNSRFDENGKVRGGPATAPLPAYKVRAQGSDLVVVVA